MPSMTRCPSGHFYDASKGSCPTCARLGQAPPPPSQPKTTPLADSRPTPGLKPTTPLPGTPSAAGPSQVTKAIWPQELGTDPIVGWLVAYRGKSVGRDYRLRTGRMKIGRADNQDVQIDDEHIHRENHAYIVFDPLNCQFLLQPGDGRGLVYLSHKKQKPQLVSTPRELSPYDVIVIGKTSLFFVPFCGPDTFQWQETGGAPEPEVWDRPGGQGPAPKPDQGPGEW